MLSTGFVLARRAAVEHEHEQILAALDAHDTPAVVAAVVAHAHAEGRELLEHLCRLGAAG